MIAPSVEQKATSEQRAKLFRALGDETRLNLLSLLLKAEDHLCLGKIVEIFGRPQGTISHHIKILHRAGLIGRRRTHTWNYYFVFDDRKAEVQSFLEGL